MTSAYALIPYNGRTVSAPFSRYPDTPCEKGSDEIRLIRIHSSESNSHLVCCTLQKFNLRTSPPYITLSYECGDPRYKQPIILNGRKFLVTDNLLSALRRLRSEKVGRWVWIDALCIHQNDQDERNSHIGKMKDIYHGADLVIAWLGQGSRRSLKAMRLLQEIANAGDDNKKSDATSLSRARVDVSNLLSNNYWSRVWIIQEIALSPKVMIYYGSEMIPWNYIKSGLTFLYRDDLSEVAKRVDQLCKIRVDRLEDKPVGLLQALFNSRDSQASNQLDRVYALLGLAFDSHKFVTKSDYGLTSDAFCMNLTENFVQQTRSLDIIFAGARASRHSGFPTWCPNYLNYAGSKTAEHMAKYISGQSIRYRLGHEHHRWNTTGTSIATPQHAMFEPGGLLRVHGIKVGRISGLAALSWERRDYKHHDRSDTKEKFTDKSVFEALDRILTVYDRGYVPCSSKSASRVRIYHHLFNFGESMNLSSTHDYNFYSKHRDVMRWLEVNKDFVVQGRTLKHRSKGRRSWALYGGLEKESKSIGLAAMNLLGSTLAVKAGKNPNNFVSKDWSTSDKPSTFPEIDNILTSLGDLIREDLRLMTTYQRGVGWAHPQARVGDRIFLLAGCSMPVILRSTDRPRIFQVIGYAYMDGMMDNEVWSVHGERDAENIWLC